MRASARVRNDATSVSAMNVLWDSFPVGAKIVAIVVLTGVLQFVALYITVLTTRRSIKQPAIRAYISVQPNFISSSDETHQPRASYILQNNGITPAYNLTHSCDIGAFPDPLPSGFTLPRIEGKWSGPIAVFPNIPVSGNCSNRAAFSPKELEGIRNRTMKIYIFGQVKYIDAFSKYRFVRFCSAVNVSSKGTLNKLCSNNAQRFQDINYEVAPIGNDAN
jgi:hypothetical protein